MVEKIEKSQWQGSEVLAIMSQPLSQETPGIGAMAALTTHEIEKFL